MREGNPGYDVIFPTNDYVERMIAADMLLPLDHAKNPNLANIDRAFADPPFDRGRGHSAPYFWGTVGLGYRASAASPKAFADLFEGDAYAGFRCWAQSKAFGRRSNTSATRSTPGRRLRSQRPPTRWFIRMKPKIKAFTPDTGQDLLIAGEVDVCLEFNGDVLQVIAEDDDLGYVVPEEGAEIWGELHVCIPKGRPEPRQRPHLHQLYSHP